MFLKIGMLLALNFEDVIEIRVNTDVNTFLYYLTIFKNIRIHTF